MERARLGSHPVVRAWRTIRPGSPDPEAVELLASGTLGSVYKLVGVGPAGRSVIAKERDWGSDHPEVVTYVRILPLLDVPVLECYGFVEPDGEGPALLFVEDAGERRYSRWSSVHRRLAGRWLAGLHAAVEQTAEAQPLLALLPDRGPRYFRALLDHVREDLSRWQSPDLAAQEALDRLLTGLDEVDKTWPEVEQVCALLPTTLVHGDFRTKNMRLRQEPDGTITLLVFDWELAGVGAPLVDLDVAVVDGYLDEAVGEEMSKLQPETLGNYGALMNTIAAVSWFVEGGEDGWWQDVATVDVYREVIEDALRACGRVPAARR